MKKYFILMAALFVSFGIASSAMAAATGSAYVNIHVTITAASGPSIIRDATSPADIDMPIGVDSVANLSPTTRFINNGTDSAANWSIHVNNPGAWTLQTGTPGTAVGVDQIRIAAIFYYDAAGNPAIANFSADDCLTDVRTNCSLTAFADVAGDDGAKGVNVGLGATKNLWLAIDAPATGTTTSLSESYPVVVYATVV